MKTECREQTDTQTRPGTQPGGLYKAFYVQKDGNTLRNQG